jgi:hypothetical protein
MRGDFRENDWGQKEQAVRVVVVVVVVVVAARHSATIDAWCGIGIPDPPDPP